MGGCCFTPRRAAWIFTGATVAATGLMITVAWWLHTMFPSRTGFQQVHYSPWNLLLLAGGYVGGIAAFFGAVRNPHRTERKVALAVVLILLPVYFAVTLRGMFLPNVLWLSAICAAVAEFCVRFVANPTPKSAWHCLAALVTGAFVFGCITEYGWQVALFIGFGFWKTLAGIIVRIFGGRPM